MRIDSSLLELRRTIHLVARETDALYMVVEAGRHAVATGDLDPLRRALADLACAEASRRGA